MEQAVNLSNAAWLVMFTFPLHCAAYASSAGLADVKRETSPHSVPETPHLALVRGALQYALRIGGVAENADFSLATSIVMVRLSGPSFHMLH